MIEPLVIELRLRDIRNFFADPEIDPFDGEAIDESGINQLMDVLGSTRDWKNRPLQVTLRVPPTDEARTLIPRMGAATRVYSQRHIQYAERKLRELRFQGGRALLVGCAFLALCLAIAAGIEKLIGSVGLMGRLLVESAVIAGWVGLWRPVELLLFDWWPYTRDITMYRKIEGMTLSVVATEGY